MWILNTRILSHLQWDQLRDSTGRAQHCSFYAHGVPFQKLHLKKTLSVQYIYLPQDLVFPSAATFHVQEAALPPMGGWWAVRLRGRNAFPQTKSFSSWCLKCSRYFSPVSRLNRQDGGWGRGEEGSSTALWLSQGHAAGQTRGPDLNPGLPNPHPPAHTPLCSQGADQLSAHLIKHTLPLPLKISRKRIVNSHSKMRAELITFYSYYLPLHR